MACALGGAQSVHANGFDEGVCLPTEDSMLLSIRTEQILQYETNITNTADPLGGSYYVEWLTNRVEERTRDYIAQIEAQGGIVPALESGWVHHEFIKAMMEYQRKTRGRRDRGSRPESVQARARSATRLRFFDPIPRRRRFSARKSPNSRISVTIARSRVPWKI